MEQPKDDMPVSAEELAALGLPENVRMTREELNRHMEAKNMTAGAEQDPTKELAKKMAEELTNEEIDRAEEAAKKRSEMGQ